MKRAIIVLFIVSICIIVSSCAIQKKSQPLIWDMTALAQLKDNGVDSGDAASIISEANKFCKMSPITVVKDKQLPFSSNPHKYSSMGPYRWPDQDKPGSYILKDGKVNPDSKYYDSAKLSGLAVRCERLSKAFYLTHDNKYYDALIRQLRAWFINEETYMTPDFEFSQVIPGQNNNKGTSTGMVDAYYFNAVIEGIRLVDGVKKIDRGLINDLKNWFLEFAKWSENKYGKTMRNGKQNISVIYDLTIVNMYLFTGNTNRAKAIADGFADRRINAQIKENGSQPGELTRTNAFSYSISNIVHFIDFCYLMRYWDKNYYAKHGQRIDKAIDFLVPYAENPDTFPYQQINGWENGSNTIKTQQARRDKLMEKTK